MKTINGTIACANPYPITYNIREQGSSVATALARAFRKTKKEHLKRKRIKRFIITIDVI